MNFQSILVTMRNEELAEQREKKERFCNIIIHGREESKEQSDNTLFVNNMIQKIRGNVTPKLISRIGRSEGNKKNPIKNVLHIYPK